MDERTNGRTTDPTVCLDRAQDGSNATDEHERWTDEREESVGTVERETVESTERVRCVRRDDAGTRRGNGATARRRDDDETGNGRARACVFPRASSSFDSARRRRDRSRGGGRGRDGRARARERGKKRARGGRDD